MMMSVVPDMDKIHRLKFYHTVYASTKGLFELYANICFVFLLTGQRECAQFIPWF